MPNNSQPAALNPLHSQAGIYLHTPFCLKKCLYCAFHSAPPQKNEISRYVAALRRDLRRMAALPEVKTKKLCFRTIFFGGGTPPLLGLEALRLLLADCFQLFDFAADDEPELSIETNPGLTSARDFQELRRMGFNRISVGVQSLDDGMLRRIGRTHDAADARAAIRHAREAGFANLNLDLMYGLPGQSPVQWSGTLKQALELAPDHLSAYELTPEQGVPLFVAMKNDLPHEDEILQMMLVTEEQISASLLVPYEISNYALFGHQCRHNCNYWHNGFWLGAGSGASSSLDYKKMETRPDLSSYLAHLEAGSAPEQLCCDLDTETFFRETVVTALRLREGVSVSGLRQRFALDAREYYGDILTKLMEQDLLIWLDEDHFALSSRGRPLANKVMEQMI